MEQQKLREQLEALHRELEQVESIDAATADALGSLRDDIRKLVDNEAAEAIHEDDSLVERLSEAVSDFEEDHPKLSMTIQYVLDTLARMGL